ncbi:allophanate hydrolase subunit 2 [Bradyrhizobium sp. USDA 4516]
MGGISIECDSGALSAAVAGGGFFVESAGLKTGSWAVISLRAGERLTVRPGSWGSWTYLAFAGELVAERWLVSASTHAISGFGGGKISPGQRLVIRGASLRQEREGDILRPSASPESKLHVVVGPQDRFFSDDALATLLSSSFHLSDAYDRMGVRLRGPALVPKGPLDMPSEPVIRGSIQISGDGVPTILLADHQTTGGYPKIATVLDCELDAFVQMRSRDEVRFVSLNPEQAINMARSRAAALSRYYSAISRSGRSLAQKLMGENLVSGVVDARSNTSSSVETK